MKTPIQNADVCFCFPARANPGDIWRVTRKTTNRKSEYTNQYGVNRYNPGFGSFGPMEQCNTGEWVRWKDVEPILHAAELRVLPSMEYEANVQDHLKAYKRRIEEQSAAYEAKFRGKEKEIACAKRAYLITLTLLVVMNALCASGVLHA